MTVRTDLVAKLTAVAASLPAGGNASEHPVVVEAPLDQVVAPAWVVTPTPGAYQTPGSFGKSNVRWSFDLRLISSRQTPADALTSTETWAKAIRAGDVGSAMWESLTGLETITIADGDFFSATMRIIDTDTD